MNPLSALIACAALVDIKPPLAKQVDQPPTDDHARRIMIMSEERLKRAEQKRLRKGWVKNES